MARQTAVIKAIARKPGEWKSIPITDDIIQSYPLLMGCKTIWANNRMEVQAFPVETSIGGVWQVTMIRHGNIEPLSWQEIQNTIHELYGPDVTAVEVFPPLEHEWNTKLGLRVVWILPVTYELPFGLEKPNSWGRHVQTV